MIEYINNRCNKWAVWRDRKENAGLGYPSQSAFTKIPNGGAAAYRVTVDEAEWETHSAIGALDDDLKAVIEVFYCTRGSAETKAAALGVHRDTLYALLHKAHVGIMDWLNAAAAGLHARNRHPEAAEVGRLKAKKEPTTVDSPG